MIILPRGGVVQFQLPGGTVKPGLIVSRTSTNLGLGEATVARITSVERERAFPTWVALPAGEIPSLALPSFVICHNLYTLATERLRLPADMEEIEVLAPRRMDEVDTALRYALALD